MDKPEAPPYCRGFVYASHDSADSRFKEGS